MGQIRDFFRWDFGTNWLFRLARSLGAKRLMYIMISLAPLYDILQKSNFIKQGKKHNKILLFNWKLFMWPAGFDLWIFIIKRKRHHTIKELLSSDTGDLVGAGKVTQRVYSLQDENRYKQTKQTKQKQTNKKTIKNKRKNFN